MNLSSSNIDRSLAKRKDFPRRKSDLADSFALKIENNGGEQKSQCEIMEIRPKVQHLSLKLKQSGTDDDCKGKVSRVS